MQLPLAMATTERPYTPANYNQLNGAGKRGKSRSVSRADVMAAAAGRLPQQSKASGVDAAEARRKVEESQDTCEFTGKDTSGSAKQPAAAGTE